MVRSTSGFFYHHQIIILSFDFDIIFCFLNKKNSFRNNFKTRYIWDRSSEIQDKSLVLDLLSGHRAHSNTGQSHKIWDE